MSRKLFLTSQGLPSAYVGNYLGLLPERNDPPLVAWIADAAEPYQKGVPIPWLESAYEKVREAGVRLLPVRLLDYVGKTEELKRLLESLDGVWVAGGNVHYLRYAMAASGFDQIIGQLLDGGLVYAGYSAGAMVAGPNLEKFESDDELNDIPVVTDEGLGLIEEIIVPHWEREDHREWGRMVRSYHQLAGRKVLTLTDDDGYIKR
jgi:dipeptidase E